MSYSAKYRGTEWGLPSGDELPQQPDRPQRSRIGGAIRALVVLLVVAGVLGGGAWFFLHGGSGTGPGATKEAPSASATADSPIVARFLDLTGRKPPLPMRVTFDMRVDVAGTGTVMAGIMNVAGDDSTGQLTMITTDGTVSLDYVQKDGVLYVRPPGRPWRTAPDEDLPSPRFRFDGMGPEDFEDLGLVVRDGRRLYHLRALAWPDIDDPAARAGIALIQDWSYDLFVTDLGVPVEFEFSASGSANENGQTTKIAVNATCKISRFSKPIAVTAPEI